MNWEAIGAVGEILGAIGVIVTLAYLATQIKQNNRLLHNSISRDVNQGLALLNSRVADDAEFADLFIRGSEDIDSLTPTERQRFFAHVMDTLNLAVYVHGVQRHQRVTPARFDMVQMTAGSYQSYSSIRDIIDSVAEWLPDKTLLEEFRKGKRKLAITALSSPSQVTDA